MPPASDLIAARLAERVGHFSELAVNRDAHESIAYFSALRAQGASIESLFQDLLAPTARRLGELWDEEINDFIDVTRGALASYSKSSVPLAVNSPTRAAIRQRTGGRC